MLGSGMRASPTRVAGEHLRRVICSLSASPLVLLSSPLSSSPALLGARRSYFWPYNEDFVPKGETTSRFQSSSVPSVRERIIREYALGPLFNERVPCCVLGFADNAKEVIGRKRELRAALAVLMSASSPEEISFGALQQTKEMLLFRGGTEDSPRLGDGPRSHSDSAERRRRQYARSPVQARTVLPVYFESVEEEEEEMKQSSGATSSSSSAGSALRVADVEMEAEQVATALGRFVQEQLEATASSSVQTSAEGNEEGQQQLREAAMRLRELGVVYCELPEEDVSDYVFNELHGVPVDEGLLERVTDRWERRLRLLNEQSRSS